MNTIEYIHNIILILASENWARALLPHIEKPSLSVLTGFDGLLLFMSASLEGSNGDSVVCHDPAALPESYD